MRKSIFIIAALFAATFANAQITLEKTLNGQYFIHTAFCPNYDIYNYGYPILPVTPAPFLYDINGTEGGCSVTLVETKNYSTYKTINLVAKQLIGLNDRKYYIEGDERIYAITYDILASNKAAFIVPITYFSEGAGNYYTAAYVIVDEDGTIVKKFAVSDGYKAPFLVKLGGEYKLVVYREQGSTYTTEIYSLPGNGEIQDIETPVAPRSSARKVLKKDQVLVENADKTYTLQGQEVK